MGKEFGECYACFYDPIIPRTLVKIHKDSEELQKKLTLSESSKFLDTFD